MMAPKYIERADLGKCYRAWAAAKGRCRNSNAERYADYGGRGITFDPAWDDFETFYKDMGEPKECESLDRIDNDKGYSKDNCRWATAEEQCENRRVRSDSRSGIKGVSYNDRMRRWLARATINGTRRQLYCGPSFEDACTARRLWESQNENA